MKDQIDANIGKFFDPQVTAKGETRATVTLTGIRTLWINTGTLCNIACSHCYIESSPTNDALAYLSADEARAALDDVARAGHPVTEIGFTGGEPFLNPQFPEMIEDALARGHDVLILTNAMKPMMRPAPQEALLRLNAAYPGKLTLRISLDHYAAPAHDAERGAGSFEVSLQGMRWLRDNGFAMAVAGRGFTDEPEDAVRAGYAKLFQTEGFDIDAANPGHCVIFPEMDLSAEVPEITTACWGILNKDPGDVMCASSRMLVKRKGEAPSFAACTLLPYDPQFDMGTQAPQIGERVALNHPHCAKFCVLGGASCAA
ncbi:radical SAM protein [Pseudooceanicola nitratireducens]|uniref:radical SAM protein n=1 Tax=Pseudooceanicola nitratireducens TaxID=517719 RepID=UPI003518E443